MEKRPASFSKLLLYLPTLEYCLISLCLVVARQCDDIIIYHA